MGQGFEIRTAHHAAEDLCTGLAQVIAGLGPATGPAPDFVALHMAAGPDLQQAVAMAAGAFPASALHGGTSCLGVMTDKGLGLAGGQGVGAFAIIDPDGQYGSASADLGSDPRAAAAAASRAALARAGRSGGVPDLVWLTAAPGQEEAVLDGVRDVVGQGCLIVGGSSADNDVAGDWAQFSGDRLHRAGVVVSVLFPTVPVSSAFNGGCVPTDRSGLVTAAEGRRLLRIDDRPATEVLCAWSNGAVPATVAQSTSILAETTGWPLGRVTAHLAGVPFHLLVHPATAHRDGSVSLFADVAVGDRLWQMHGSTESLIARAADVAREAVLELPGGPDPGGALVIYCAGCMLAVQDRMEDVRKGVADALGPRPFLGLFTFGEQGHALGGQAQHGNLMISCTVFGRAPA